MTTTSPEGRVGLVTLDADGRPIRSELPTAPWIEPVEYSYITDGSNLHGRLESIATGTGPERREVTLTYDALGNVQSVLDPIGRELSFVRDAANRITEKTLPDLNTVEFGFDANGNLESLLAPGDTTAHTLGYTGIDLMESYAPPPITLVDADISLTYTPDRQVEQATYSADAIDYAYDSLGRVIAVLVTGGGITFTYFDDTVPELQGKLDDIYSTIDDVRLEYTYAGGLLLSEATSGIGTPDAAVEWDYDNDFRVVSETVAGDAVAFTYDDDGLVVQAGPVALDYDVGSGQLATTTVGNITDDRTRNSFGEVVGYDATFDDGSGPVDLYGLSFERDNLGRIWRKTETVQGQTTVQEYEYDARGRLTDVYEGTDACDVVQCELTQQYDYDANGNRTSFQGTGPVAIGGVYDAQDRLVSYGTTTYTYNDRGDLIARDEAAVGVTNYDYDAFGLLRSVDLPDGTVVEYVYDGVGRRIGRVVDGVRDRTWIYGGGLGPIAELDGSGAVVQRYLYARWAHVPSVITTATASYRVITNHIGAVVLVVDTSTGGIAQELSYGPFGGVLFDSNPGFQPFGFAGGLYDEFTGLTQFGARWYDPQVGRWTQKDPVLFFGNDMNLYGYVGGDPINRLDPSGLILEWSDGFESYSVFMGAAPWVWDQAVFAHKMANQEAGDGNYLRAAAWAQVGTIAAAAPLTSLVPESAVCSAPAVASTGASSAPASVVRPIQHGEKVADIVDELKHLTLTTGNEHAIVSLQTGERLLVSGGQSGISFEGIALRRLIAHTHPYQLPATGPSGADRLALQILGQRNSYLLEHGLVTKFGAF